MPQDTKLERDAEQLKDITPHPLYTPMSEFINATERGPFEVGRGNNLVGSRTMEAEDLCAHVAFFVITNFNFFDFRSHLRWHRSSIKEP